MTSPRPAFSSLSKPPPIDSPEYSTLLLDVPPTTAGNSSLTTPPSSPSVATADRAVDLLAEQLREKLDVSWTCVNLLDEHGGVMKSYADRQGMPLFGSTLDAAAADDDDVAKKHGDNNNNNNNSRTGQHHQPRGFAVKMITPARMEKAGFMEVYDTWQDERFHENVYVQSSTQRPYSVRFYAAAPIYQQYKKNNDDDSGTARCRVIGTLGVCHHAPKRLTLDEKMLMQNHADEIGRLLVAATNVRSKGPASGGVKRARKRSMSRDDSEIGRRNHAAHAMFISDGSLKSPLPKRSASCGPTPLITIVPKTKTEVDVKPSTHTTTTTTIENPMAAKVALPNPKTSTADPDEYLAQLVKALSAPTGTVVHLQIKPSHEIVDYFPEVTEEQMARYNVQVVSMARNNDLAGIRTLFVAQGRDALDCYNRFGEGLLTLACRRGFRDMVQFFLSDEVRLPVRVRDDYGRTPVHDACWNPAPQLEICSWIMEKDPSLFLLADKRGFTAFQYARQSEWHIWRQFLFDHVDRLRPFVTQPVLAERFAPTRKTE